MILLAAVSFYTTQLARCVSQLLSRIRECAMMVSEIASRWMIQPLVHSRNSKPNDTSGESEQPLTDPKKSQETMPISEEVEVHNHADVTEGQSKSGPPAEAVEEAESSNGSITHSEKLQPVMRKLSSPHRISEIRSRHESTPTGRFFQRAMSHVHSRGDPSTSGYGNSWGYSRNSGAQSVSQLLFRAHTQQTSTPRGKESLTPLPFEEHAICDTSYTGRSKSSAFLSKSLEKEDFGDVKFSSPLPHQRHQYIANTLGSSSRLRRSHDLSSHERDDLSGYQRDDSLQYPSEVANKVLSYYRSQLVTR
eukprot:Filipodium_phascolosomae@DN2161_c0_g1_i1.p1